MSHAPHLTNFRRAMTRKEVEISRGYNILSHATVLAMLKFCRPREDEPQTSFREWYEAQDFETGYHEALKYAAIGRRFGHLITLPEKSVAPFAASGFRRVALHLDPDRLVSFQRLLRFDFAKLYELSRSPEPVVNALLSTRELLLPDGQRFSLRALREAEPQRFKALLETASLSTR